MTYLSFLILFLIIPNVSGYFETGTNVETIAEVGTGKNDNPLGYSILISGFDYYSDANRRANLRYHGTSGDVRIVETFKQEASFNKDALGKKKERGLCQLLPNRTNIVWINDPRRSSGDYQAQICLEKWLAVPEKTKGLIRSAFKVRHLQTKNIVFIK